MVAVDAGDRAARSGRIDVTWSQRKGVVMRVTLVALVVATVAGVFAAPVSAGADVVVVAGYGRLSSGDSVAVGAVSSPLGVRGSLRVETVPGFVFVSEVTCVRVVGERVLVGGRIVRSTNPVTIGNTSLVAVEDSGRDDRLGIAFSNSGLDSCPVFDLPMHPVEVGNLIVVA
jgi:hypothetical protein